MVAKRAIKRRLGKNSSRWIQGAIKHPGAFSSAAHKAGASTQEYANRIGKNPSHYGPKLRRRAALAKTLAKMRARR